MDLNGKVIYKTTGILMVVIGASMCPAILVAVAFQEWKCVGAFTFPAAVTALSGLFLAKTMNPSHVRLKVRDGFLVVALCWLLASLIGCLPYIFSGEIPRFADAFFETASGLSTTGASILTDIEPLPRSILFWRSFTQWLGGMGILIFAIALLPALGLSGNVIAKAEAPGPTLEKLTPKITDTAKILYALYIGFTIVQTVLLLFGGMSLYDAVLHTFTTISTGGFSPYNASIAHFDSAYIDTVITVFMIAGGASFNLYFLALRHGIREFMQDTEFKLYIAIIGLVAFLITLDLFFTNTVSSLATSFRHAIFQTASIITTTGFASADYDLWPTFCKMLIFMLMFIGGCSSSTGGGIKVVRIFIVFKLILRGIFVRLHPNAVVSMKFHGKPMASDVISRITSFVFLYIVVIFAGSILISLDNRDLMSGISAVATCLGNIGPGFNEVGPTMNFSGFSEWAKMVLSLLMLTGRLELFTLLMLFLPSFWNPNR